MDFYHSWIYVHILNTKWLVWSIVILIFGGNILAPLILWCILADEPLFRKRKKKNKDV